MSYPVFIDEIKIIPHGGISKSDRLRFVMFDFDKESNPFHAISTSDGTIINVSYNDIVEAPFLPATGITGFQVFVNSVPRIIASQFRKGSSGDDAFTISLLLSSILHPDDIAIVNYDPGVGNVTDSTTLHNPLPLISNLQVDISFIPQPFFDIFDWIQGSTVPIPINDLIERRVGYSLASILLDTTPPMGDVVLNEYPNSGGIQCHHFDILDNSSTTLSIPAFTAVEDIMGNTIRQAHVLGGAVDISSVENIGYGNNFSLVKYLTPIFNIYPTVSSIEFGMTANKAKDYVLEVKQ